MQINFVRRFLKQITLKNPHLEQVCRFPNTTSAGDCAVVNELKQAFSLLLGKDGIAANSFTVTKDAGSLHRKEKGGGFVQGVLSGYQAKKTVIVL